MHEQNPLNAFIVDAARKNRSGRRKKRLRDIIKLGKGSEVIVRPTIKSSEEKMGDGEIKEESNIFRLLRRKRKPKTSDRKLIRKNMKASGSFPPLQPAAMSESDLKCDEDFEAEGAERAIRGRGLLASALWVERKRYTNFATITTLHEVTNNIAGGFTSRNWRERCWRCVLRH